MEKAIVLLSGGLDSATCLAIARSRNFECYALSFDYGQRHRCELRAAAAVARSLGAAKHAVMQIDLRLWGGSALTDDAIAVPDASSDPVVPVTYVPARNMIFLSLATAWGEVLKARHIFIGVNSVDYSGYPDCRGAFIMVEAINVNWLTTSMPLPGTSVTGRFITPLASSKIRSFTTFWHRYSMSSSVSSSQMPTSIRRPCPIALLRNPSILTEASFTR